MLVAIMAMICAIGDNDYINGDYNYDDGLDENGDHDVDEVIDDVMMTVMMTMPMMMLMALMAILLMRLLMMIPLVMIDNDAADGDNNENYGDGNDDHYVDDIVDVNSDLGSVDEPGYSTQKNENYNYDLVGNLKQEEKNT